MTTRPRRPARGFTILEAVIAMTVMVIGLVGTLSALVFGSTSTKAARAQTLATAAAAELVAALGQLSPTDPRLAPNVSSGTVPSTFGPLLAPVTGTVTTTGTYTWSDASPIPGVRTDAQLAAGPEQSLQLERRWVVWDYTPPGVPPGQLIRMISVSVVYQDATSRREVVMYGQRPNLGALLVGSLIPS